MKVGLSLSLPLVLARDVHAELSTIIVSTRQPPFTTHKLWPEIHVNGLSFASTRTEYIVRTPTSGPNTDLLERPHGNEGYATASSFGVMGSS